MSDITIDIFITTIRVSSFTAPQSFRTPSPSSLFKHHSAEVMQPSAGLTRRRHPTAIFPTLSSQGSLVHHMLPWQSAIDPPQVFFALISSIGGMYLPIECLIHIGLPSSQHAGPRKQRVASERTSICLWWDSSPRATRSTPRLTAVQHRPDEQRENATQGAQ